METVIRVAVIYLLIMVGLRIMGKREFGELSPLELVTLLLIPEIVSQALVREDFSLTNSIIGLATLFGLVYITSLVTHLSPKLEKAVYSQPTVLVQHGQFIENHLNKERITPDEIYTAMRKAGLYQLSQVRWAVLETDGKIAIVPEEYHQIHTAEQTANQDTGSP